jgi:hypothetical protein
MKENRHHQEEGDMSTEIEQRQRAMRLRLAGERVEHICTKLERSRSWFYKWWQRYCTHGMDGLREHSRAPQHVPRQTSDEVCEAIRQIRKRLMQRRGPQARYRLAGAPTIRRELEGLGYTPLPSLRTIERVIQQAHYTNPAFRTQPPSSAPEYPSPRARASNQVHQLDLVGPRYLKGSHARYYFLDYKDVYDLTPHLGFQRAPNLDMVLEFVVQVWQRLGLPRYLQVDNDRLFSGTGRWSGSLNRFIRLALLVGVELVFIPEGEPFRNGCVEHFNGWFQERLLSIQLHRPAQVRRELHTLMDICFREHVHAQRGFQTSQQLRRSLHPRRLPANFDHHRQRMPIAVGKITFMRKVRRSGRITILGVKVFVGKRKAGHYVRAVLYTRTATLKIYLQSKFIKQVDFPIRTGAV